MTKTSTKRRSEKLPQFVTRNGTGYRSYISGGKSGSRKWLPTFSTAKAALRSRIDALSYLDVGVQPKAGKTWKEVTDEAAESMTRRCKPGTVDWFRTQIRSLSKALDECRRSENSLLVHLDADCWNEVLAHRRSQVSNNTVAHNYRALSMIYTFAGKAGILRHSPLVAVDKYVTRETEAKWLTEQEFWSLFDAIMAHDHKDRLVDAAIFSILFLIGLRRSEICRLTIGDLKLTQQPPRIFIHGKRKDETIQVSRNVIPFLETLIGDRTGFRHRGELLLRGGDGRLRRAFQRWAGGKTVYRMKGGNWVTDSKTGKKRAFATPGLLGDRLSHISDKLHPHALRHSFCTGIITRFRDQMTENELMQLARIRSRATLDVYLHLTADFALLDEWGSRPAAGLRAVHG